MEKKIIQKIKKSNLNLIFRKTESTRPHGKSQILLLWSYIEIVECIFNFNMAILNIMFMLRLFIALYCILPLWSYIEIVKCIFIFNTTTYWIEFAFSIYLLHSDTVKNNYYFWTYIYYNVFLLWLTITYDIVYLCILFMLYLILRYTAAICDPNIGSYKECRLFLHEVS